MLAGIVGLFGEVGKDNCEVLRVVALRNSDDLAT